MRFRRSEGIVLFRLQSPNRKLYIAIVMTLLLATLLRFANIGWSFSNNGIDEGIMLERALLISRGFNLYSELPTDQAPLWLQIGAVFGGDVLQSRILNATVSILALIACMVISRRLAGNTAMWMTGILLAVDFAFLRESRLFSLDGASSFFLAFSMLALLIAIERNSKLALMGGGFLLGLSTVSKLHGGIALLGILVFFLVERYRRDAVKKWNTADLGLLIVAFVIPIVAFMISLGPEDVLQGMVFNQTHRDFDFYLKLSLIAFFGLNIGYIFPLVYIRSLWRRGPEIRLLLCIALVLLAYFILQPLIFFHHLALLSPPLAILAGVLFSDILAKRIEKGDTTPAPKMKRIDFSVNSMLAILITGLVISGGLASYGLMTQGKPSQMIYAEKLQQMTGEDDYVIAGDPLIAAYADRPIPPTVVNIAYRMYPQLTTRDLHTAIIEYNVSVVIVCYRLNEMEDLVGILSSEGFVRISPEYIGEGEPGTLDLFQKGIEPTAFFVEESLAEELQLPIVPSDFS